MVFILAFLIAFLLNVYVLLFGKVGLEHVKSKISISKYLTEIKGSLESIFGKDALKYLVCITGLICAVVVIVNAVALLMMICGIVAGTFIAKKACQFPATSNVLNKIATYINRLK